MARQKKLTLGLFPPLLAKIVTAALFLLRIQLR
jgi:hypothetical protein